MPPPPPRPPRLRRPSRRLGLRRLGAHALFWGGVAGFFVLYFGRGAASYGQSFVFVALLLPVAMGTTYAFTGLLVPRFLRPGRTGRFVLYAAYTLVASVYLQLGVVVLAYVALADYRLEAMNPAALDVFGMGVALYAVVFGALAVALAARGHRLQAAHAAAEQARLAAELALRDAELARLRTQMHPHFLFNTLNNLYALALEGAPETPDVVLRLADLLDYVLYRCDGPAVPLAAEAAHLRTYLDLERLRVGERVAVTFEADDDALAGYAIAPLLLVPFVENAFRHGARRAGDEAYVRVVLRVDAGALHFRVTNSTAPDDDTGAPATPPLRRPDASGIGLDNVRRRLALLYPDAHALAVEAGAGRFDVRLRLPLWPRAEAPGPSPSSLASASLPA